MIYKNVASQKIAVFTYTAATGAAKTGDAAQITAYISKDWGGAAAIADTNPTELDATNMKGWYVFDLTQAETNANVLVIAPVSSTSGVVIDQVQVFTTASVDQTGDSYARLGAPAGASISADIAAIEAQTDDIGAAGAGLTGLPWNAAWDAEVESEATDALNAYDPPTNAEMVARTLLATSYFDPAADTVANVTTVGSVTADTTILPDSVAADGTRPTPQQALLMLTRFLFERGVVSATMTVYKEDGVTDSMTFTLDSASAPTTITRST